MNNLLSIFFSLTVFVLSGLSNVCIAEKIQNFSEFVDNSGTISLPEGFRTNMSHLGSWFVPTGDASGFHDVYANQADIKAFRNTGRFPDGAIIIKELRASNASDYTTGKQVNYATGTIKQWFVMIKDSKNKSRNNKNWGDGWGWALFKPENRKVNVSTDYKKDCLGCHMPAKNNDFVYIEGYPTLSKQ